MDRIRLLSNDLCSKKQLGQREYFYIPNYVDKGFLEDRGSVIKNTVAKKYVQHDFFVFE